MNKNTILFFGSFAAACCGLCVVLFTACGPSESQKPSSPDTNRAAYGAQPSQTSDAHPDRALATNVDLSPADDDMLHALQKCIASNLNSKQVLGLINRKPVYDSTSEEGRKAFYIVPTVDDAAGKPPMSDATEFLGWILYANQGVKTKIVGIAWNKNGVPRLYVGRLVDRG